MIRYGFGSKISLILFIPLFILQFLPTSFKSKDQKREISEGSEEEAPSKLVSSIKGRYSQRQERTKAKMKVVSDNQQLEWFSDDIITNILSRIPARSVMRFRCVSKRWYYLTHNPYFIDMHLSYTRRHAPAVLVQEGKGYTYDDYSSNFHLYSFDDRCTGTLKAITSIEEHKRRCPTNPCNGLICLTGETDIVVLNLTTQESVSVLKPSHMRNVMWDTVSLAFQPSANKYKLVWLNDLVGCDSSGRITSRFELMTLGSPNSWRSTSDVCYGFASDGLCLGGIMYYLVSHNERFTGIVSLDLEDEKFREVPVPSFYERGHYEYTGNIFSYRMYELDGNLCLTHHRPLCGSEVSLDIWVLEDPVKGLWIKHFDILLPRIRMEFVLYQYLLTVYNGHALLYRDGGLSCCVVDNTSFKLVDYEKIKSGSLVCTYMETLVTVKNFA